MITVSVWSTKERSDFPSILHKHTSTIQPNHRQSREDEQQNKGFLRTDNNEIYFTLCSPLLPIFPATHTLAIYVRLCECVCVLNCLKFLCLLRLTIVYSVPYRGEWTHPSREPTTGRDLGTVQIQLWPCVCVCVCFVIFVGVI